MNFKVDENLPIEVARQFQMAGHDASTVIEEGLGGESDSKIIDRCQRESRALITLDIGFGIYELIRPEKIQESSFCIQHQPFTLLPYPRACFAIRTLSGLFL